MKSFLRFFEKAYFCPGETCFRVNVSMEEPKEYIVRAVKRSFKKGVTYVCGSVDVNDNTLWNFNNINHLDTSFCYDGVCKDLKSAKWALRDKRELELERTFRQICERTYDYKKAEIKISDKQLADYKKQFTLLEGYLEKRIPYDSAVISSIVHKIILDEEKAKGLL